MLLATILLMCPVPQAGNVTIAENEPPVVLSAEASTASSPSDPLPSMPEPKVASASSSASDGVSSAAPGAAAVEPGTPASSFQPVKPASTWGGETPRQRKIWYTLLVTSTGAAAFDAWSTQHAVSQGFTEANPFLRPFAGSNAIYAATQVSPVLMDFIGKRMMTSRYPAIRKLWWIPQAAGSGFSIGAGVHNVRIAH